MSYFIVLYILGGATFGYAAAMNSKYYEEMPHEFEMINVKKKTRPPRMRLGMAINNFDKTKLKKPAKRSVKKSDELTMLIDELRKKMVIRRKVICS